MEDRSIQLSPIIPVHALQAGLFVSKGKWKHSERTIQSYELILVRSGTLSMFEEDRKFLIGPGQTLLLWPGMFHGGIDYNPEDLQFFWIHFHLVPRKGKYIAPITMVPQTTTLQRPHRLTELYRRILDDQELGYYNQTTSDLIMMQMLCEVSHQPTEQEGVSHALRLLTQRAETYIRTHFDDPISTESIAQALDCSPNYLGRSFRVTLSTTPINYLHKVRVEHSCHLLINTDLPISAIAAQCGFQDAGYFRRIFARHEHMSPMEYRKLYAMMYVNTE